MLGYGLLFSYLFNLLLMLTPPPLSLSPLPSQTYGRGLTGVNAVANYCPQTLLDYSKTQRNVEPKQALG